MSDKCAFCGSEIPERIDMKSQSANPALDDRYRVGRMGEIVAYSMRNIPSESEANTMRYCASLADKYAQSFDEAYIPLYDFAKKLRELADVHEQILAEDMNTEQPCICGNRKHEGPCR